MTPETAIEKQIQIYRRMTGEERMSIAFGLHELACEMARSAIRQENPGLEEAEVERLLRARLEAEWAA